MQSSTRSPTAVDVIAEFFERLAQRGYEPLLRKTRGTVRVDLTNGRQIVNWLITIEKGNVRVTRENADALCVVRADRPIFERVIKGEANAMAAMLRGAMEFEGDPELLVLFQRLFSGPADSARRPAKPGGAMRRT